MRRLLIYTTILLSAGMCLSCGNEVPAELAQICRSPLYATDEESQWAHPLDSAPDGGCMRMRFPELGSISRMFNDSNHVHLEAAEAAGISPVTDLRSAWDSGKGLTKIQSCREYYIAPLTHSYPYLVPEAAQLLKEIGERFADSLASRGGGAYRPKVTSVLRTPRTVGKLRRVNRNATNNSAHQYATTFDISYSKFVCDDSTATRRTFEDLKNLLAEIIRDLRAEGRCYVKRERKQACFHITVRHRPEASEQ